MISFGRVRVVALVLFCAGSLHAEKPSAAPDWVAKGTRLENGFLYGVGVGMSRADALAAALGELATLSLKQTAVKSGRATTSSKIFARASFGSVSVATLAEDFMSPGASGSTAPAETASRATKVVMKSGNGRRLVIKVRLSSIGTAQSSDVEIHAQGLKIWDLIDDLKNHGVEPRYYLDAGDGTEFVGLSMRAPRGTSAQSPRQPGSR